MDMNKKQCGDGNTLYKYQSVREFNKTHIYTFENPMSLHHLNKLNEKVCKKCNEFIVVDNHTKKIKVYN